MANNLDDITAIRLHYLENCAVDPTIFDNDEPQVQPTGIHARLSVDPGASRRMSIASRTYEQLGNLDFELMIPEGIRDHEGWEIATKFAETFRDLNLDNYRIRFETPTFAPGDKQEDWYVIAVSVPYKSRH